MHDDPRRKAKTNFHPPPSFHFSFLLSPRSVDHRTFCVSIDILIFALLFLLLLRVQQNISSKPKTSNINRSESYKERIHHKVRKNKKKTFFRSTFLKLRFFFFFLFHTNLFYKVFFLSPFSFS